MVTESEFASHYEKTDTCWNWIGYVQNGGYGTYGENYKKYYAHRTSYELYKGEIPVGLQIDHLCRNRRCVNPEHLEAVTIKENTLRGMGHTARRARQTHCIHGHPLSGENLSIRKEGYRACRQCNKIRGVAGSNKSRLIKKIIKLHVCAGLASGSTIIRIGVGCEYDI